MQLRIGQLLVVFALSLPLFAQETPQVYVKKATWAETMRATRANYQAWRTEKQGKSAVTLGPWYATGPLKSSGFSIAFPPEQEVDLTAKAPDGKLYWHAHDEWIDGIVWDLPSEAGAMCSTYLFRTITTDKPGVFTAGFGSDDGIEVWLNGAKVLSKDVPRGAAPDEDIVPLNLLQGENKLLLKIFNRSGGHAFYFAVAQDCAFSLLQQIEKEFPIEIGWMKRDMPQNRHMAWLVDADTTVMQQSIIVRQAATVGELGAPLLAELEKLSKGPVPCDDPRWLDLYARACRLNRSLADFQRINFAALRLALDDLTKAFPDTYKKAPEFLAQVDAFEKQAPEIKNGLARDEETARGQVQDLLKLQRDILMANPLLDFDKMLIVKRGEGNLGLPQNWQGDCALSIRGYDNEIDTLSLDGKIEKVFRPKNGEFVGDVDLNFDADKMLFSMPGSHDRWQIWEAKPNGTDPRQVTPGEEPDVDNYDACYLPDGRITFGSTRCFQGIPCVGGANTVANLCRMDADGANCRQLCFDQDHNWCPTVMNDGRVLYTRWEYSDTPHYFSRLLFHMNPDGTEQAEYYHSNSFWPNSTFYARPIPNHPTKIVAIISGHHGVPRMGELMIFDPAKGRHEAEGVVQRIPGYGKKVEPIITDQLVDNSWPKFLHPYPLSDKYFLVSCKPTAESLWGIYLVDIFDNMLLLREEPGYALFEPLPLRKSTRPPVIPDRVKLDRRDATVYVSDLYNGGGLKGVPRGTIKHLRLYEVHYCYPQMGGHINIGVEGPWDVHRILGTVPVFEDGSAFFTVPANTPIAVQPLDEQGRAVQLMRSWFSAMPGEILSCVGCHERQNSTAASSQTIASRHTPSEILPWRGPARGFSFKRDVQPALDKFCVGCHNGAERPDGQKIPDFSAKDHNGEGNFTPSYLALHPYVRRPGPESDYHLQVPYEFHASTSELIQMLEKGHHGVKLDDEAWDRLYTWIDLNVPDHGTWHEHHEIPANFHERRIEMRTKYANRPEDPEAIPALNNPPVEFVKPEAVPAPDPQKPKCDNWPFNDKKARKMQDKAASQTRQTVDLGDGVTMDLVMIPAGEFVMGGNDGAPDEYPLTAQKIDQPFWMGTVEVTNAQYNKFDAGHINGFIDQHHKDHNTPGYPTQAPGFPVIRVTWDEANAFCKWLGEKTGKPCALPTEAQWEWACRAGTETPFYYGDLDTDFSPYANLADYSMRLLAVNGVNPQPIENPSPFEDFLPKDARFNDGAMIVTETGKYLPNAWGLYDMLGNVAEWTRTTYKAYPYADNDGRNDVASPGRKVVRGGSWADRPKFARASYRLAYEPWQPVYNVGFRVIFPAQ